MNLCRAFAFPAKAAETGKMGVIIIYVYAPQRDAAIVFEQAQGIVSSLKFPAERRMPSAWLDGLEKALDGKR